VRFSFFSKNLSGVLEEKERREKKERRAKDVVIEILLSDVVMEKHSLEEKTSLSTQVGAPGPEAWASPPPTGGTTPPPGVPAPPRGPGERIRVTHGSGGSVPVHAGGGYASF
jgi:hypothetical protein